MINLTTSLAHVQHRCICYIALRIFPITELLSEAANQRWIAYYFHPQGLRCPCWKTSVQEARQFRHSQRGLVDYGCTHC
jgi:hypothetical protein